MAFELVSTVHRVNGTASFTLHSLVAGLYVFGARGLSLRRETPMQIIAARLYHELEKGARQ